MRGTGVENPGLVIAHPKKSTLSIYQQRIEASFCINPNVPNVLEEKGCVAYVPTIDLPTGLPPQKLNNNVATIIEK